MVQDLSTEHQGIKIKVMLPSGPGVSFQWPKNDDCCWVPVQHILCHIDTLATTTGKTYTITNDKNYKINNLYVCESDNLTRMTIHIFVFYTLIFKITKYVFYCSSFNFCHYCLI